LDKQNLKDLYIEEIEKILYDINQERYRAKQIFQWIYRGVCSFDEMSDLSHQFRQKLSENYRLSCLKTVKVQRSSDDTFKYLFELEDENAIESVLMKYKYGYTACVSTQVGCKMGCKFCASTHCGFVRNLSAGEIVDQIIAMQKDTGNRVSKVVFMGIGEPLDNYENSIKAMKLLNNPLGLNIGLRNISVSTSGIVPAILKLAQEGLPVTLSVSLHAPNDKVRNQIMPVNKVYNIDKLLDASKKYAKITKRRISFEYILIRDLNDSEEDAAELASKVNGILSHVNLIQLNPTTENSLKRSTMDRVKKFVAELTKRGIQTTLRRELGTEIEAACGQLRLKHSGHEE
jgi:23S rRNA (adenine2503-C2)-methyltransferase